MSDLRYFLLVVFAIDAFLLLGQYGATQVGPGGTQFIDYQGSITSSFDQGNYTISGDVFAQLPVGTSSQSPTTGNIFTDPFTTIKSWIQNIPGVNYVTAAVNALPNWLQSFNMDPFFAYAISAIWHIFGLWLIIEFFFGR